MKMKWEQFLPLDKPFYHDIYELALWLIDIVEIDNAFYYGGDAYIITSSGK